MTGPAPEQLQRQPEQQGTPEFAINTGVSRLLAGRKFYNPAYQPSPAESVQLEQTFRRADAVVPLGSISAVSLKQRRATRVTPAGQEASLANWAHSMTDFVISLQGEQYRGLRAVLSQLGVVVDSQNRRDIVASLKPFWEKYLKDKSNIQQFFHDVYDDILRGAHADTASQMRIRLAAIQPLLPIFGGEETQLLLKDASVAYFLAKTGISKNETFASYLADAVTDHFVSDAHKRAYALLWNEVKDTMPRAQQEPAGQQQLLQDEAPAQPQPDQPPQQPPRVRGREAIPPISALVLSPAVVQHEKSFSTKGAGEAAMLSVKSPEHPSFSADRALVGSFGAQEGFFLAAIRGGSKTEAGANVATIIQQSLEQELSSLPHVPTVEEGVRHMVAALSTALPYVESIRRKHPGQESLPTSAVGLVCTNGNGQPVLVTLNIGNNAILKISPTTKKVTQLTTEHASSTEFATPEKQATTRSISLEHLANLVDDLEEIVRHGWDAAQSDTIRVTSLEKNTLYLALTSGVLSHIPPEFLSQELFDVWNASTTRGKMHVAEFNKKLAALIREKMLHPQLYMYHGRVYPHADDLGIASLYLGK